MGPTGPCCTGVIPSKEGQGTPHREEDEGGRTARYREDHLCPPGVGWEYPGGEEPFDRRVRGRVSQEKPRVIRRVQLSFGDQSLDF